MDIPLELAFHNMAPSGGLTALVRQQVRRLERVSRHIIGCRVVIEMPHKRHRQGQNAPDVHVLLRVPGREIVVSRERTRGSGGATNAYAVLRDAFAQVQQRLRHYRSRRSQS
jgi:ribosome-associated translation inhibitor RaiA